jgi:hypothetical protein
MKKTNIVSFLDKKIPIIINIYTVCLQDYLIGKMYSLQRDIELLALVQKKCPGGDLESRLLESIKARTQQQAQQQAQQMTKEQREALHNKAYRDMTMAEKEAFKDAWLNDQIPKNH